MRSSRLPGKVLRPLAGRSMLEHVVRRAQVLDAPVAVLTSETPSDDPIEVFCRGAGVALFRGSEDDVLERFRLAAIRFGAQTIVRLTADNPLIDPRIVEKCIAWHAGREVDLSSTREFINGDVTIRTAPCGMSVDVIRAAALERTAEHARTALEREHVIPVFFNSGAFRTSLVELGYPAEAMASEFSVDTEADALRVERLLAIAGVNATLEGFLRADRT